MSLVTNSKAQTQDLIEHARIARWSCEGDDWVLRAHASQMRAALSPALIITAAVIGGVGGLIASGAGVGITKALLTVILLGGTVLSFGYIMYLSILARDVTLRFTPSMIEIRDGSGDPQSWPYTALTRLLLVHDGAPAKIILTADGQRISWVTGQIYRMNGRERLIEDIPSAVVERLGHVGLHMAQTVRGKILRTEFDRIAR